VVHQQIVDVAFEFRFVGAQARRGVALRVEVYDEHSLAEHG
jgi:hypothetical protein